jgi:hypothetical protein
LFNEPWNGAQFDPMIGMNFSQAAIFVNPFYERLIDEVRSVDPNHILVYQPVGGWAVRVAKKIDRPNLIFSFHWYDFAKDYSGNASLLENHFLINRWNAPTSDPIKDWNIPIWIGEFGIDDWRPNADLWTRDSVNLWTKYELGWAWWTYWKSDTYGKSLLYANGTERAVFMQHLKNPLF